jgi:hypothetical protein
LAFSLSGAIQKLLHFAVSDVADDVRRAAVINLGFVLLNVPEQTTRIVSLLVRTAAFVNYCEHQDGWFEPEVLPGIEAGCRTAHRIPSRGCG